MDNKKDEEKSQKSHWIAIKSEEEKSVKLKEEKKIK